MHLGRLSVLVLVGLLAFAPARSFAEDAAARKWYEVRALKVARTAAQRLWEAADRARRESLFRFAREEAARVVELDPDHRLARAFLGYVKKDDGWQIDPEAHARLAVENQAAPGVKLVEVEEAWRRAFAARADADVAVFYASFADECAAKGLAKEAHTGYLRALELDPANAAAHLGVGHVKFAEGLWISREAQRAYEQSRVVNSVEEASRWEEIVGAPMAKAESTHFHMESPLGAAAVEKYLGAAERAYAAWFGDLGLDPQQAALPTKPLAVFCVVKDDAQWNRWIDHVAVHNPGFSRNLAVHWASDRWATAIRDAGEASDAARETARVDRVMHQTVHMLDFAVFGLPAGCWADEALAYRIPILLTGSTRHFCLSPRKEDYASAGVVCDWLDSTEWKAALKESVAHGDDLALRAIVTKSAFQLPLQSSVKAWSVLDFLLRRDRAGVAGMLRDLQGLTDTKDCLPPLETRFGKSVEILDEEWRKWVLSNY